MIDKHQSLSEFIGNKIRRYIPQLEVIDYVTIREIYHKLPSDFDIFISTTLLPDNIKNQIAEQHRYLIHVDEILLPYDINLIKKFIKKFRKEKYRDLTLLKKNLGYDWFYLFAEKKFLYVNHIPKSKKVILKFLCTELHRANYINALFFETVLQRERFSSTYIGNGIALAHGESEHVKQDAISIYYSRCPMKWDKNNQVQLVILLSLKKSNEGTIDHRFSSFYTIIAKLADNKSLIDEIASCKTSSDLYQFIRSVPAENEGCIIINYFVDIKLFGRINKLDVSLIRS